MNKIDILKDREIRLVCLELALEANVGKSADSTQILNFADKFEQFIKNGYSTEPKETTNARS